jgi:hypothetical protein
MQIGTDTPFGNDDGDVSPYIELAIRVCGGDLNACIAQAVLERDAKDDAG